MKFFTDELLNQSPFEESDESEKQWRQAAINYQLSLEPLKGKVSRAVWEMAYNNSLHDAKCLGINILHGDNKKRPTTIEITFYKKRQYKIRYRKVMKFELVFDELVTGINHLGIDDCVYSELLEVDTSASIYSHELIFSSGAKFFIQFEKISLIG